MYVHTYMHMYMCINGSVLALLEFVPLWLSCGATTKTKTRGKQQLLNAQ